MMASRQDRHGLYNTKTNRCWRDIKQRCLNPNEKAYPEYGGRGISIWEGWLRFPPFYEYVSKLEHFDEKGYSIDRIDNNGNYEPGNVKWSTRREQALNTRTPRRNPHTEESKKKMRESMLKYYRRLREKQK